MPKIIEKPVAVNVEVLGLDVHQGKTVWCRLDRRGHKVASGSVESTRACLEQFLDEVVGRRRTHVALEACGGSLWVYDLLVERYGRERVHLAHARHVQVIARSTRKNDLSDAYWLAHLTKQGRLPEAWVPVGLWRDLRLVSRERRAASKRHSQGVNRVRAQLRQMGLRLPTTDYDTKRASAWLDRVVEEAPDEVALALRLGRERIEAAKREVAIWTERLDAISADLPQIDLLEKVLPGTGRILAATVLAETGPVERFQSPKGLARYAGLTPSDRSTGGRVIHGRITREGSGDLRWALSEIVIHCLSCKRGRGLAVGNWVRARYRRTDIKAKVKVAAARKMAETVWRAFHLGEDFDVRKPFGGGEAAA